MSPSDLPPLDCHAHIAPDVTGRQIAGLNGALVFAMTRTPSEARAAARRSDPTLAWGFGAHPGLPDAISTVNETVLREAVQGHVIVGEVGLDRRGPHGPQREVLEAILHACQGQPVLLSLHSTGRTRQLLAVLRQRPHPGAVLHWFNGTPDEICEAVALGCYFSVNNAMTDDRLAQIPTNRMLPETDFPASRKSTLASKPGDIHALEKRLARRDCSHENAVRHGFYRTLGGLLAVTGARSRMPSGFQAALDAAGV
ncbi:TatD family hydrolase [Jatrophihabitans cynanchi]|uniref:TatD family hydrolase n=1 Tax=Jatrophihabitans cynanchi TaxID=2944128 RepID=A0ABY7JSW6_9ACTN|nr:TatD family hydrolase [Jatrophihabitans sp. SB3-54]WAX55130.1 TatD family hydrolase [Jatrophihabitans sp. SB3-54]